MGSEMCIRDSNDNKFTLGQSVDVKVIRSDSNKRLLDLDLISF